MDYGTCNVVYYDRRAGTDYKVKQNDGRAVPSPSPAPADASDAAAAAFTGERSVDGEVKQNVDALLASFIEVHVCHTVSSCLSHVLRLSNAPAQCVTLVVIQVSALERGAGDAPMPASTDAVEALDGERMSGSQLLGLLRKETDKHRAANLVLPIVLTCGNQPDRPEAASSSSTGLIAASLSRGTFLVKAPPAWKDPVLTARYLDDGAIDVLASPMTSDRVKGIPAQIYRVYKNLARGSPPYDSRRLHPSALPASQSTRYHYMREAMVSSLVEGICNPGQIEDGIKHFELDITPDRQRQVAGAIAQWPFSAHDFNDDELLFGVKLMLEHALKAPGLEHFRLDSDTLTKFLVATRQVYNSFVLYHNFRHACDVTQATFYFLLRMKALPPYSTSTSSPGHTRTDQRDHVEALFDSFHTLTILIAAVGHDVGHPGVNNLFLVSTNTPLAQLYSDRSVLESFHCAAYAQILRRYWPAASNDKAMRKLMIHTILATDMAEHRHYMGKMAEFQGQIEQKGRKIEEWAAPEGRSQLQSLLCCLVIKCADISNVPRPINIATQWARILTDEFVNQHEIEEELQIPTCLFGGVPQRNDMIGLGNSQISFITAFGEELFRNISSILPSMSFTVTEIEKNKKYWQDRIAEEQKTIVPNRHSTTGFGTMSRRGTRAGDENLHSAPISSVRASQSEGGASNGSPKAPASQPGSRRGSGQLATLSAVELGQRRSSIAPSHASPLPHSESRRSSAGGLPQKSALPGDRRRSSIPMASEIRQLDGQSDSAVKAPQEGPWQASPPDPTHAPQLASQTSTSPMGHGEGLVSTSADPEPTVAVPDADSASTSDIGKPRVQRSSDASAKRPYSQTSSSSRNANPSNTGEKNKLGLSATLRRLRSSVNLNKDDRSGTTETIEEVDQPASKEETVSPGHRKDTWKFWRNRSRSAGPGRKIQGRASQ